MKRRFEIPIEPGEYNLFDIDDYLRSIRSSKERQQLIATVGYSAELRRDYERRKGLPFGAVELAMMAEDKRVKEINGVLRKRLGSPQPGQNLSPEELMALYRELESMALGLKALYPEAVQFMLQYGVLARRNAASFQGDYQFNNEYKVLRVACPNANANANADECFEQNTCWYVNFNYAVNFNAAIFLNAAILAYVAILYGYAVLLAIWALVLVIP